MVPWQGLSTYIIHKQGSVYSAHEQRGQLHPTVIHLLHLVSVSKRRNMIRRRVWHQPGKCHSSVSFQISQSSFKTDYWQPDSWKTASILKKCFALKLLLYVTYSYWSWAKLLSPCLQLCLAWRQVLPQGKKKKKPVKIVVNKHLIKRGRYKDKECMGYVVCSVQFNPSSHCFYCNLGLYSYIRTWKHMQCFSLSNHSSLSICF